MIDDDDDQPPQAVPMSGDSRNNITGLSVSRDDSSVGNRGLSIGGLNISNDDDGSAKKRKADEDGEEKAQKPKRKRRRKTKRKIVLNDQLELTGAEIRAQLADTSDIVRQDVVHPATWVPGTEPEKRQHPNTEALYKNLPYERLFCRPTLGDDGRQKSRSYGKFL